MKSERKLYTLYPSTLTTKKYDVWVVNPDTGRTKKVSFGASGYEDYTTHEDTERRAKYRTRHAKDKIKDPTSSGFWSWHVLWGDSTSVQTNLRAVKNMLHVN